MHFNRLRLDAISILDFVINKGATHGARHSKTEVQREYHLAWNAWKRCCKKVDSQGEHFLVVTIDSCVPVCRESQLEVRTKVKRAGWICERRPCIQTHSRRKEKIQRTMVSFSEQSRQKWACEASTWLQSSCHDEKSLTPRIKRTHWRAHPSRSTKTHTTRTRSLLELINMQVGNIGFHLQVPRGGPHQKQLEVSSQFFSNLFFVAVGFVYRWLWSTVTDWVCEQNTLTPRIFSHICTHFPCSHAPHGSRCRTTCLHKRALIHMSSSLSSVSTSCPISSPPFFCSSSMWSEPPSTRTPAHTQNEKYGPVATQNPLTDDLEATEVHAPAHISQDPDWEHPAKVVTNSRKHSIYTHFHSKGQ